MKHVILTLGIFSLGFLTSCDSSAEPETKAATEQEEQQDGEAKDADDKDHDHDHDAHHKMDEDAKAKDMTITLNDGEKWVVNEEMKPFVKQGETLLREYIASESDDYKALAEELAHENNELISSCTMEGESHDELHKWLHPHLELTKKLEAAENKEEANEVVEKLLASYEEFGKFFK